MINGSNSQKQPGNGRTEASEDHMEKTITIDGTPVKLKATALTPRLYMTLFGKDMIRDLYKLKDTVTVDDNGEASMTADAIDIFTRTAYVMAKQAGDPSTNGLGYEEWLDQFSIFGVYQALPEIYTLWGLTTRTTVQAKKKKSKPRVK